MPDKPASYCAPCGAWHEGGCPKTKAVENKSAAKKPTAKKKQGGG